MFERLDEDVWHFRGDAGAGRGLVRGIRHANFLRNDLRDFGFCVHERSEITFRLNGPMVITVECCILTKSGEGDGQGLVLLETICP